MSLQDIRSYLMKQLAELADSDASPEQVKVRVDKARATAEVSRVYIESVETEMEAIRLFDETGLKNSFIEIQPIQPGVHLLNGKK